jgi:hypothetical protein
MVTDEPLPSPRKNNLTTLPVKVAAKNFEESRQCRWRAAECPGRLDGESPTRTERSPKVAECVPHCLGETTAFSSGANNPWTGNPLFLTETTFLTAVLWNGAPRALYRQRKHRVKARRKETKMKRAEKRKEVKMTEKYDDLARPIRIAWFVVMIAVIALAGIFEV